MFYKIIHAKSQKAVEVFGQNVIRLNFENNNTAQEWAFEPINFISLTYRIYSKMYEKVLSGYDTNFLKLENPTCTVGINQVYQIKKDSNGFCSITPPANNITYPHWTAALKCYLDSIRINGQLSPINCQNVILRPTCTSENLFTFPLDIALSFYFSFGTNNFRIIEV